MADRAEVTHSYAGRIPECGCVVCAIVEAAPGDKVWQKEVAAELAKWVKRGLTIERLTHEEIRSQFTICKHKEPAKAIRLPGF